MGIFSPIACARVKIYIKMCCGNCSLTSSSNFVPSQVSL